MDKIEQEVDTAINYVWPTIKNGIWLRYIAAPYYEIISAVAENERASMAQSVKAAIKTLSAYDSSIDEALRESLSEVLDDKNGYKVIAATNNGLINVWLHTENVKAVQLFWRKLSEIVAPLSEMF